MLRQLSAYLTVITVIKIRTQQQSKNSEEILRKEFHFIFGTKNEARN